MLCVETGCANDLSNPIEKRLLQKNHPATMKLAVCIANSSLLYTV